MRPAILFGTYARKTLGSGKTSQKHAEAGKQAALVTQFTGNSPFGGSETDMLVTVARPEGLFYLIFGVLLGRRSRGGERARLGAAESGAARGGGSSLPRSG